MIVKIRVTAFSLVGTDNVENVLNIISYGYCIIRNQVGDDMSSDDDDKSFCEGKRQRKIGPGNWESIPFQNVNELPEGIDGLCRFNVRNVEGLSLKDGRKWKKDSRTEWQGFGRVRYANCFGSYKCSNEKCIYKVNYGVINTVQFKKQKGEMVCSLCNSQGSYVPCDARRYWVRKGKDVQVFQHGVHKCSSRPTPSRPNKEDIQDFLRKKSRGQAVSSSVSIHFVHGEEQGGLGESGQASFGTAKFKMDCQPQARNKERDRTIRQ